jgi:type I restriction enzyme S subunit
MSELPGGWDNVELGQFTKVNSGSPPPRLGGESIIMGANGPIGHTSTINFAGGILVGRVGAAGAVHLVRNPCWASDNVLTIVPQPGKIDVDFLAHLLDWSDLSALSTKTAQPLITQSQLRKIWRPIPLDIEEQRRIAGILDATDRAIRTEERLITKLARAKEGLLQDLFSLGVSHMGGSSRGERRPVGHATSLPSGWSIRTLRQVATYVTYGFTNPMPTADDGPWMLTAADIGYGRIEFAHARHTTTQAFNRDLTNKSRPRYGDILITKDGTLGRVAKLAIDNVCVNQSVAVVRLADGRWSDYIMRYLLSPGGQSSMLNDSGGSTIKHLYISKLAELPIPLPTYEEAEKIVAIAKQWECTQQIEIDKVAKLRLLG